jgi:tRNA pseudouridine55 synthase
MHGWLNINKMVGISSNQTLNQLKKILPKKTKIGFLGTLDPFASGVLPVAIGEATKTIFFAEDGIKEYIFHLKFGEETDSLDLTGKVVKTTPKIPTELEIIKAIANFSGEITQTPPAFSAIKINGERAYNLARQGQEFAIKQRQVYIHNLKLLSYQPPIAKVICKCSKGTYIRSLGRDIALSLQTFGHLVALERTQNGKFLLKNSVSTHFLLENIKKTSIGDALLPVDYVLDGIPVLNLDEKLVEKIKNGVKLSLNERDGKYKVLNNKILMAIVEINNNHLRILKNLNL